ncbi:ATP-binding protein [Thermoleptolyngbya sp. M55_K2018_002]|uniref:ATP-binding protein n=1 Tax=Thermoleptolyngbya sp. M55_K2018_002 TaxID=2747808 RepID=UPI0025DDFEE1|nr:ATP-binding protein [Thermoleptolyngbya sp. M55_K2018_002]
MSSSSGFTSQETRISCEVSPTRSAPRSTQLTMLRSEQIQVDTQLNELNHVLAWFDGLRCAGIPELVWLQCQLALAEGFTNAVRHAHRNRSPDTPIEISVTIFKEFLEIQIWDCGPTFNLRKMLEAIPDEVDRDAAGGRGLLLMKKTADVLDYRRSPDQRNCLLFVKHYTRQDLTRPD